MDMASRANKGHEKQAVADLRILQRLGDMKGTSWEQAQTWLFFGKCLLEMSREVPLGNTIQTGSVDEIWDYNCHLVQSFRASHPDLFLCRFVYTTRGPVVENRPVADFRYPSSHLI